jgi:hypothetical protein
MSVAHVDVVADPKPGSRGYLKWYWTKGPGLAKWATSPHPFTALRAHLIKFLSPAIVDSVTAKWFHDALGFYPSEKHIGPVRVGK